MVQQKIILREHLINYCISYNYFCDDDKVVFQQPSSHVFPITLLSEAQDTVWIDVI